MNNPNNRPFKSKSFGKPPVVPMQRIGTPTPAQRERMAVIDYLQQVEVEGMRKALCFSCSFVKLYDKNNKEYFISRTATLQYVKAIVEEIKKVNSNTQ